MAAGMRSGLERSIAADLSNRGVAFQYEAVRLPYTIEHEYVADFLLPNGIIVEAKGLFDAADRRKMLAVIKAFPDRDIRMLFQAADNRIAKNSKTTYAQWCDKHGIKWAEGRSVPEEWLATTT